MYANIAAAVFNEPWVIMPEKMAAIVALLELRMRGEKVSEEEIKAVTAAATMPTVAQPGQSIAVLPLFGTLSQHGGMMQRASGGTSTEEFSKDFRRAISDPQIGTVVLHIHSPGGSVYGVEEAANLVYEGRQKKPVIAAVNSMCASGAYWIASQCSQIALTPGGEVGSIGVISAHQDVSKAEENIGVKTTLHAIPAKKAQFSPYGPLSDDAVAELQSRNQATYEKFTGQVARGRGVKQAAVKSAAFGGGGMLKAEDALAGGMVDRVATLDQVISGLLAGHSGNVSRNRAALALAEAE